MNLIFQNLLKLNEEKLATFAIEILNIEEPVPFVVDKDFLDKNGLKNEDDLKNNLGKTVLNLNMKMD